MTKTTARYHIRRVKFLHEEYDSVSRPYGIFDTHRGLYVNKYGEPECGYWCSSKAVAEMRRRDLNEHAKDLRWV